MNNEPTVFIVDDHPGVREGLLLLAESAGLHAEAFATAEAFLDACDPARPGCLVLDVRMPGMSGLDLLAGLDAYHITLPVIILTGHGDVPMSARAFKAGAVDFVEKPFQETVLLDSIRNAVKRDAHTRPKLARLDEIAGRARLLSAREREVMDLVVAGHANKEMAHELDVHERTIEFHRKNVMKKMKAESLPELVEMMVTYRTPVVR